ncbi:MAG: DUF2335 domain-containing protein [bacterium]|nr:DUF2335 domain-containing protein [bacterium]
MESFPPADNSASTENESTDRSTPPPIIEVPPQILEGLPEDKRESIRKEWQRSFGLMAVEVSSGPLPSPKVLKGYEEVLPGSAERILTMAEKQLDHRQKMESAVVYQGLSQARLGLIFGFIILLIVVVGAIGLLLLQRTLEGFALVITAAVGAAAILIRAQRRGRAELDENRRNLDRTEEDTDTATASLPDVSAPKR